MFNSSKNVVHFVHMTKSGTKNYKRFEQEDMKAHLVKLSRITGHDEIGVTQSLFVN